jgi:hypothetical protein
VRRKDIKHVNIFKHITNRKNTETMSNIKDSKNMKNILKAITPLRRRIHFNRVIAILTTGLVISAGLSLILAIISIVMPIPFLFKKMFSIYLIFTVSSIITSLLLRPGLLHTLKIGDRLGLDERLVTAYYYMDDNSLLSQLQVKDTLETVKKKDFKRLYPLKFPMREFLIFLGLTLLVAATSIIPSSPKEKAVVMENTSKEIEKQIEKIDKEKDEILEDEFVVAEIEELLKELKQARNEEDAIKALSITRNKLEEKLEELIEKGQDGEGLEGLSDGLEKKLDKKLDKELEKKLDDLIASLDNSKNKIADTAGRNNINLAQIDKLGSKGQQGKGDTNSQGDKGENSSGDDSNADRNGSTDNQSMGNQGSAGNDTGSTGKSGSQSGSGSSSDGEYGNIDGENGSSGNNTDGNSENKNGNASDSNQTGVKGSSEGNGQNSGESASQSPREGSGQSDGEGSSQGTGQGSNSGKGTGEGTGQGAGEGSGDGAGEGSSNGEEGHNGENYGNGSAGREPGKKKSKDYEMVYIPKRLGGDTKASSVKGSMSDSGDSIRYDAEGAPVEKGYMLPYNEVLQQYKDEAVTGIENHPVPPGMKEIVRDYFSSLE